MVSFRGTHNAVDWLDDFDALQVAYPGVPNAWIHKGFYDAWKKELRASIMIATEVTFTEDALRKLSAQ